HVHFSIDNVPVRWVRLPHREGAPWDLGSSRKDVDRGFPEGGEVAVRVAVHDPVGKARAGRPVVRGESDSNVSGLARPVETGWRVRRGAHCEMDDAVPPRGDQRVPERPGGVPTRVPVLEARRPVALRGEPDRRTGGDREGHFQESQRDPELVDAVEEGTEGTPVEPDRAREPRMV